MNKKINAALSLSLLILVAGCSSNSGRYEYKNDHQANNIPSLDHVEDAVPRYEPYSRGGNTNYRVRGIDYEVVKGITSFTEQGYASWYGNKFHGHLTSNGERYDMYAMSAAHKNLPLPSYVEVTNLENNRRVIVRVNDRGPFHKGRIIDLSYAAANKLDIIKSGTAKVEIKLIHIDEQQDSFKNDFLNGYFYVQYLVTSQPDRADSLSKKVAKQYHTTPVVVKDKSNYRLRLGPFSSEQEARALLSKLKQAYPSAFVLHQKKR